MSNIDALKQQHLSMFEKKRDKHKKILGELYMEYISKKSTNEEDNWELFSNFYLYFSERFPCEIYENEKIVGTNWHWKWSTLIPNTVTPNNAGHFIPSFQDFLQKGVQEKINEVKNLPHGAALETCLKAFSQYIKNYSDTARKACESSCGENKQRLLNIANDCEHISNHPPTSFRQALQLIWFIKSFLDMESNQAAISLGRADSYLYPYFENDIKSGILTYEDAKELIMCFYIKASEGDESCMLTVGGDVENELTALFIDAQTQIKMRQPSIALRVCRSTSEQILSKATELVLVGNGMPAYFNDDVIIKGLKNIGINDKDSNDYGVVGCYEAAPQGVFSNTVACSFNIFDPFSEFLELKSEYTCFSEFLDAYKEHFDNYYKNRLLPRFKTSAERDQALVCPFASTLLNKEKYIFGINISETGILIDSIHTIKKLVFDEKYTTIEYLLSQAKNDFTDDALYEKILNLKSYYGSNDKESNELAKEITSYIGKVIRRYVIGDNVIISPSLFIFTQDIWHREHVGMVNGRKKGELLSYGIMPCEAPHSNVLTSALLSCANVCAEYFPNGCPAMIRLDNKEIEQANILPSLIKTFFEAGGFHLAINTLDAETLQKAKEEPKEYSDIIVKISGYSAHFTTLNEKIQNAVIERARSNSK